MDASAPAETHPVTTTPPLRRGPTRVEPEVRMRDLLGPHAAALAVVLALQAIGALAGLVPLLAVVELGRALLAPGPPSEAHLRAVVAAGALGLLARLLFTGASAAVGHLVDGRAQLALRRALADRLGRLPIGWLARQRTGELTKVVGDDVSAIHPFIAHTPGALVSAFLVPLVSLAYLVTVDWRLSLVTLGTVVLAVSLLPLMMTPPRLREQEQFDAGMARLSSSALEFVQGIAVVKAVGDGRRAHQAFSDDVDRVVGSFARMVRGLAGPAAGMQLLLSSPVVLLAVLVGGAVLVVHRDLPATDLLPFLLLGPGLTAPVAAMLGHGLEDAQSARRAVHRVRDLLAETTVPEPAHPVRPVGHRVELRGVRFGYDADREVLRGIDLVLEPGTTTAVVGPSGSGKSTLVQLLPRFFDPASGRVTLGGVDLRDVGSCHLHRMVSFVFQDVRLLRASIRDNIALAVPDADHEAVVSAAHRAGIHDRVVQLPRGYETVLGDEATLSGGEAQRISIARALLADSPVLVLDEATAFADPLTERAVSRTLASRDPGQTVLLIAHRMETVAGADSVAFMEDGVIVEHGTPAALLAQDGRFAEFWRSHHQGAEDGDVLRADPSGAGPR